MRFESVPPVGSRQAIEECRRSPNGPLPVKAHKAVTLKPRAACAFAMDDSTPFLNCRM